MHEFSIVQALIHRVEAEAASHHATAIRRIEVRMGELAGVDPELLASAWEIARTETICSAAALNIVRVDARWTCPRCGVGIEPGAPLRCPRCDEPAQLTAGGEIMLDRIEMEVA